MPLYAIRNKKTGEIVGEEQLTFTEVDEFEVQFPQFEIAIGMPLIHSGAGLKKPDDSFRDVLRNIKKKHSQGITKSTINTF